MESFGDVLTAMVTPFTLDLQVDQVAFARLADHLLENGSDGLVVAGTTGESPTLTDDEKVALFRHAVEVAGGRGPVIAGTGSNDTEHSVALTRRAEDAGVDGVLVVTPYYNKPPERGLRAHFAGRRRGHDAAGDHLQHPVALRRQSGARAAGRARRASTTSSPSSRPTPTSSSRAGCCELCDLGLYAGNDDMTRDVAAMGGWGCISVASHLVGPRLKELVAAARRGDAARAAAIDRELAPLFEALFVTSNPIPLKAALNMLGHEVGGLRLPLVEATDDERRRVEVELERLGLL